MRKAYLFLLLASVLIICGSWGFLVHRTVHQLAVYELPGSLKKFFYKNIEYVVSNSTRPDLRRSTDSTEASKHFIDLEAYGDSAAWKIPFTWNEAVKFYTKDTLLKYGYVPYVIVDLKDKLTNAFRSRDKDSILFYAADIGHYIGDANVPLHTTLNYDGQLTNQKGLHSLWESMVPEIEITNYNLYSRHQARYLKNPAEAIIKAIRRAHIMLPGVLGKEKEVSKSFTDAQKYRTQTRNGRESKSYTSAFAKAYAASLKTTINDQLINSANLIADFWYTSWVDSGKPDVEGLITFSKEDKRELKKEYKVFKSNTLIKNKLLRSKKSEASNSGDN
jgi:hypothetical protein